MAILQTLKYGSKRINKKNKITRSVNDCRPSTHL
jgi:hypothetical protein